MVSKRNILFTIGIDWYQSETWKDLNNAVADCKAISNLLVERYSFEEYPSPLFNEEATKENIYNSFNSLKHFVESSDRVIIIFAGHGNINEYTSRGYWIPHDANLSLISWIENSVIKDFIEDLKIHHVWLISDSCFSGSFLTNTRSLENAISYQILDDRKSRWMLSSGSKEKVSDGFPKLHSPFSNFLIKYLITNTNKCTSISEIYNYVFTLVKNNSNQTPLCAFIDNIGYDGGEMILTLISEYVKSQIEVTSGVTHTKELRDEYLEYRISKNKIACGKEILLVKSFIHENEYLILELFRFDDDGNKKIKFSENKLTFPTKDGELNVTLIQRFSTWKSVDRFLENNTEYRRSKIAIINAHEDIDGVEELPVSLAYSNYLNYLLELKDDLMSCLHCGDKISTNDSFMIEVDESGLDINIGNVHKECIRPSDRIIGQSGFENLDSSELINFNYELWYEKLRKGQGQLVSMTKKFEDKKILTIMWNETNFINEGRFCIKENFEDGSSEFMMIGGRIQRFNIDEVEENLGLFSSQLGENSPAKIPESGIYGLYKTLLKLKKDNQNIVKVISFSKSIYSQQFESKIKDNFDYAPLCLVKEYRSDKIVTLGKLIPLVSKPENFDIFYKNWKEISKDLENCYLKIIGSDIDLNNQLSSFFREYLIPVIDPVFNIENGDLLSGIIIKDLDLIISEQSAHLKKLEKGTMVKVAFPKLKPEQYPIGCLMTDEFYDEENESSIIFQPFENGKPIKDMKFKIPTKLIIVAD